MGTRLFVPSYNSAKLSLFRSIGEVLCPIIMSTIELSQLYSLGPKQMYMNWSFKVMTDFLYPIAALVYFKVFRDLKLEDYDGYEKK